MNGILNLLELLLSALTKLAIQKKLRGRNVYVVCGLRRSGNHAVIQWLMNSIAGESITYESKGHRINYPTRSDLLFLNNWSGHLNWKRKLSGTFISPEVKHIVISFEDESPYQVFNYFKGLVDCRAILIRRNRLDLIASRFQTLISRSKNGEDLGDESNMNCSQAFISLLKEYDSVKAENDKGIVIFDYDKWTSDVSWGKTTMHSLALNSHSIPKRMTREGGGSSFLNLENLNDDRLGLLSEPEAFFSMLENGFDLSEEEMNRVDSVKKNRNW